MTNEEKNWVNDMLEQVADISEEQVEQMVDEIPQASEEEDISDDTFYEIAHKVEDYADCLKDVLSMCGVKYSIVFGVGIEKRGFTILRGSSHLCAKLIPGMAMDFMKAMKKRESESGEHEG